MIGHFLALSEKKSHRNMKYQFKNFLIFGTETLENKSFSVFLKNGFRKWCDKIYLVSCGDPSARVFEVFLLVSQSEILGRRNYIEFLVKKSINSLENNCFS